MRGVLDSALGAPGVGVTPDGSVDQRRYVESLSAYARQFLGQMEKPDVDQIDGLSPAISIDQKGALRNPRSTVGTVTEIYDHLGHPDHSEADQPAYRAVVPVHAQCYCMCMYERRLQLLLDRARYERVAAQARRRRVSVAMVIRDAIDVALPADIDQRRAAYEAIVNAAPMSLGSPEEVRAELDEAHDRV